MTILLMLIQLAGLPYPVIPLARVATTARTHVCVTAPVVYVRLMKDKDIHITLDNGTAKVVAEIIPQFPLPRPKKGSVITVCGITRFDKQHRWPEIHPVTSWR